MHQLDMLEDIVGLGGLQVAVTVWLFYGAYNNENFGSHIFMELITLEHGRRLI